ncbi:MAG: hypothetical protein QOF28_2124 [Actinomycetota bacterium]|nr:hypothetical protein [Actinomycetota bacterium]
MARMSRRRCLSLLGVLVLVGTSSACRSAADAKASPTSTSERAPTTVKQLNPDYDSGDTVFITTTGFQPKVLIAAVKVPLHFVNHTKAVQRVQFEHSRSADGRLIATGPIPPGGTWSYTPQTWESATYHSVDRPATGGQIQIQPPADP